MNEPQHFTEEQIAAAQLRIVLDERLGRQTPEAVRRIAGSSSGGTLGGNGATTSEGANVTYYSDLPVRGQESSTRQQPGQHQRWMPPPPRESSRTPGIYPRNTPRMQRLDEVLVAAIERDLGPDHPETLAARLELAIGKADAGPTRDVFEMVEQLREDMLRVLGEEHPELEKVDALLTQMRNSADSEQ